MTPRIQLLRPSNLIGYPFSALSSQNRSEGAVTSNRPSNRPTGGVSDFAMRGESAAQRRVSGFGAEIIHLIDELTLGGDSA